MDEPLRELAARDGRYAHEAFRFLLDSLEYAVRAAGKTEAHGTERHITGQELVEGLRQHAQQVFGPLAAQTWRAWGIHDTLDWGKIVFLLVEKGLLRRQDSDTIEDFSPGFDFDRYFVDGYEPELPSELGQASDG